MTSPRRRATSASIVALSLLALLVPPGRAASMVQTRWLAPFGMIQGTGAAAVAGDSSGVYVVGGGKGGFRGEPEVAQYPGYVRRYSSSGNLVWSRQFRSGSASDVASDATGVYVAGGVDCGTMQCLNVRKYDPSGDLVWTRTIGGGHHDVDARALALTSDALYVAGVAYGALPGQTISGGAGALLIRLGLDGTTQWVHEFSGPDGATAWDVDATDAGVYVTGETLNARHQEQTFVRRYDADGTLRWNDVIQMFPEEIGSSVVVDGHAVFLAGYEFPARPPRPPRPFIRRFDTRGRVLWTKRVRGEVQTLAPYGGGFVLTGTSLRAFSSDGALLWSFSPDAVASPLEYGVDVSGRRAYMSGSGHVLGDPIRDDDVWVSRLRLPPAA